MNAEPTPSTGLWGEAFRVERGGIDLRAGLAGGIASCAPLAVGIATGHAAIGSVACFGGLNAALGVPRGPLRGRLGWGAGAALACSLSVLVTTAVQDSTAASVIVAFVWIALATMLRTFGAVGGLAGFVIGAMLVILGGIPAAPVDAGERMLWFAAGSALGTALMVLAYGSEPGGGTGKNHAAPAAPPLAAVIVAGARQYVAAARHDRALQAHALRLATAVAATTLLYRALGLEHGYWIPLTVLAILQPDEHASRVRAIQRAVGTLCGTAVIALLTVVTGEQWVLVAVQGIAAGALFSLFARGYFWLVVLLTPTALLTVSAVDYQGAAIALERAGWSALGIACGLAVGEAVWQLAPHLAPGRRPWESTGAE
ncbi:MAG TPA: FUSC family protein [Conexibacter sp.]|jgi:hypothetical protein